MKCPCCENKLLPTQSDLMSCENGHKWRLRYIEGTQHREIVMVGGSAGNCAKGDVYLVPEGERFDSAPRRVDVAPSAMTLEEQEACRAEVEYRLLRYFYEVTGGRTDRGVSIDDEAAQAIDATLEEAEAAAEYLKGEFLLEQLTLVHLKITHEGVREVRESLRNPSGGTDHFEPQVIMNVTNNFSNSVVGVNQAGGTGNVAHASVNVTNTANNTVQNFLEQLEAEVAKAPPEKQTEARSYLDAIVALSKGLPATVDALRPVLATLAAVWPNVATVAAQFGHHLTGL